MIPNKEPFAVVVNKQNIADIHVVPVQLNHLAANQIRIRIEHFGLSANNVTYAVTGDSSAAQKWDQVHAFHFHAHFFHSLHMAKLVEHECHDNDDGKSPVEQKRIARQAGTD